jgi:hypothetical protein
MESNSIGINSIPFPSFSPFSLQYRDTIQSVGISFFHIQTILFIHKKKMPDRTDRSVPPTKKNERERELASRFECSNGPAALCSQNSWPATCTTASVYTHTDIICWKKRRKEEDNETLAQLKAFFFAYPSFFFYIQRFEAA